MGEVVTPEGRPLAVREGGDPAGVPVLSHSGTPGSGLLYEPHVRDAESKGIRLFSYDRPGYGGPARGEGRTAAGWAAGAAAGCEPARAPGCCARRCAGGRPPPPGAAG